jgi:flavin-dependent dehydrogenase
LEKTAYDLIVVGAGPAGSACAITAARAGAKVLLLDKDRFPRQKVCGEFVSPESLELLDRLLGPQRFAAKPQISKARVFSGTNEISMPIAPAARSIPRFELDAALLDAARRLGVETHEAMTVSQIQQKEDFEVSTRVATFSGRAVVNASGRWSHLTARTPVKEKNKQKWIGVKAHFHEPDAAKSVDLYFFAGGYCGVQPVSDHAVNACAMVRADVAHWLEEVFPLHPALHQRSRKWKPLFPEVTTSPLDFHAPRPLINGMILAGDAAAFIDPFAGDGISLALHSGTLAAECLALFLRGKWSLQQAQKQYAAEYKRRFTAAFRNAARVRMVLSAPAVIRSSLLRLAAVRPIARAIVRSTRIQQKSLGMG